MSNNTYNGWTNYATWRVNLEIFDGVSYRDLFGASPRYMDIKSCADALKEHVEENVQISTVPGIARDYALAFLSDVNWREIAEHVVQEDDEDYEPDLDPYADSELTGAREGTGVAGGDA